jgi:hypothetical protein
MVVFSVNGKRRSIERPNGRNWLDCIIGVKRLWVPKASAGPWPFNFDDRKLLISPFIFLLKARSPRG